MKLKINKSKISTQPDFLFSIPKRLKSPFLDFVRHSFSQKLLHRFSSPKIFRKFGMKFRHKIEEMSHGRIFDFRFQKG
jgi:hypothetical protein